ncbi:MAG: acyl carrier protein [Solobacterium sp.]|nr:acyl carrier protein [Solobacterium sp.]
MSDQEMMQELLKIIHVCLPETETENVTMDTVINRDLGADSMSFILMMTKVEAVFNVRIPEDSWKNLATVRDVIKAVRKAQGNQNNG